MSISNVGSVVLHVVVFLATLVNFHSALAHVEPLLLIGLYIISRVLGRTPDDFWHNAAADDVYNGYVTPREDYFSPRDTALRERGKSSNNSGSSFEAHDPESLARMVSNARRHKTGKIGIRDRICCYQWTWFTLTMATGGISNVFHSIWTSYETSWIYYIGVLYLLFNICLFIVNCVLISMRFYMVPGSFYQSFRDQVESLFIPAVVVSTGTILINICEFAIPFTGPWLIPVMECLYWIYIGISMIASAGMYLILWSTQIFPIHMMTPVWVFPAYPLLLSAPYGSNLIAAVVKVGEVSRINATAIAFCALSVQGTGFLISFMICAAFIYRLMTQKLPGDMQRPGVFISIGPSGFTVAGIVLLGQNSDVILPRNFEGEQHAAFIVRVISLLAALWLWGLSIWFFMVSVGSLWKYAVRSDSHRNMPFQMTWWSFVFPNTALVTATLALARALGSAGLRLFGCVMAACLVLVWFLIFATMTRCIWRRELLWPKELESSRR